MLNSPWRNDFPILQEVIDDKQVIYLDTAATAQKPQSVIDAVSNYYLTENANAHSGLHSLSERATLAYASARNTAKKFINAESDNEIVFVRGATEGLNLIANCYALENLKPDDEIIVSQSAHHANIVPWQHAADKTGARLRVLPVLSTGCLDLTALESMLSKRTKLVAIDHISNVLGCINDIKAICSAAHAYGAKVIVDAAQSAAHVKIDVQDIDCDFLVFSGHKLYGPTGIGVLYARESLLDAMPPYQLGGGMIETVSFAKTTYNNLPYKFEAGTPNVAGAVGLRAALNYLTSSWQDIISYEQKLHDLFLTKLRSLAAVNLVASPDIGVYCFTYNNMHPHDMATILNASGVAIRAGHHCAMPLIKHLGHPALLRVSLGLYNNEADLQKFCSAAQDAQAIMGG